MKIFSIAAGSIVVVAIVGGTFGALMSLGVAEHDAKMAAMLVGDFTAAGFLLVRVYRGKA